MNGRFDFQSPLGGAWPLADLVIVEDAGHGYTHPGTTDELVRATDRFAD